MSEPTLTRAADDAAFFGHPRGLKTLFFTEMWERFSYYGMRAILMLFMTAPIAAGGLAFSDAKAGMIYGIYTASVYLLSLPGGWIADRFLGQRKAVFHGGVFIMFGHISLAWPAVWSFYLGLVLIALGTGLLKPNISTMVGQLYTEEDARRDGGFSIYYMGINIGAFMAPLACGFLAQHETFKGWLASAGISPESSWHFGFACAAVGMFLGLVQYVIGDKAMGTAGKYPVPAESPEAAARNRRTLVYTLLAVFGIPAVFAALMVTGTLVLTTNELSLIMLAALITVLVGFFAAMFLFGKWSAAEKKRLLVIMLLCLGATIFFADFEQAGSTLNLFAERHTATSFLGFDFPASWLQSANALFIIILAPVFGVLWTWLGRRGKNPASPAKFAVGMLIMALSFIWMLPPAGTAEAGGKSGPGWLLMLYLLHTIAELCISPVGLSSMTKLAPARIAGMVMGMWFAAIALGNYLSGAAAGVTAELGYTTFFIAVATPPAIAAILFAVLNKPIHRMLGDMKVKH